GRGRPTSLAQRVQNQAVATVGGACVEPPRAAVFHERHRERGCARYAVQRYVRGGLVAVDGDVVDAFHRKLDTEPIQRLLGVVHGIFCVLVATRPPRRGRYVVVEDRLRVVVV